MLDTINGDDDSDRLLVRWRLLDPAVVAACGGRDAAVVPTSSPPARSSRSASGRTGAPVPGRLDGPTAWSPYRATSPRCARRPGARPAVAGRGADVAVGAAAGRRPDHGFDRDGWYVVRGGTV
jgi:hypothetical protein